MDKRVKELIEQLEKTRSLTTEEYKYLLDNREESAASLLAEKARSVREQHYGKAVYIRGLIEVSNICKNNCLYCGIRGANSDCDRYRLTAGEIISCADEGYRLGFRTFVLQGGEDSAFTDDFLCGVIGKIKENHPDCAITLSLGERSFDSYKRLYDRGADRYLLRHETADKAHYERLHPKEMSFENRMECLYNLKKIGYQTGCGFMVGSPYQTNELLAKDLKFIEEFAPDMCGIGPFIPHPKTPFAAFPAGSADVTCYLLSIIRLIHPKILLPSTTALGTVIPNGREKGLLSGANVVMPNLSPVAVRKKYELYADKICTGEEAAQCIGCLSRRIKSTGYEIVTDRGDVKK